MKDRLPDKLGSLPRQAGVYYHLDAAGRIIYVGKAADLRSRVRQYFHKSVAVSPKDQRLREEIRDVRWALTADAYQALLLESEMIKRYQPKYNVLQRNRTSSEWYYIKLDRQPANPRLSLTRTADQPGAEYLGPFMDSRLLKRILKYLRRYFPFSTHKTLPAKACLDYHLGLCPGPETADFDSRQAQADLRKIRLYLKGRQNLLLKDLRQEMQQEAEAQRYERAAQLRNQIKALVDFKTSIVWDSFANLNLAQDQALADLADLFRLGSPPARIEAYDISHLSGSHTTASMVVAEQGILKPALQRRFKAAVSANNDYAQIEAVMKRRFGSPRLKAEPDLILIDGGRGQVAAVAKALQSFKLRLPVIGLAKRKEELIFRSRDLDFDPGKLRQLKGSVRRSPHFTQLELPLNTPLIKLVQRLRDASHRLALSYHHSLRRRAQTRSPLLDLPGIGPQTYRKLIRHFGSKAALERASAKDLAGLVNRRQLEVLSRHLQLREGI